MLEVSDDIQKFYIRYFIEQYSEQIIVQIKANKQADSVHVVVLKAVNNHN
jgi:hypothetical protein